MAQIDTTNLDAGTDKIKLARPALLAIAQFVNKLLGYTTDDITSTEKTSLRNVLDVPKKDGTGASGNWGVNAATATKLSTAVWTVEEVSGVLHFKHNGTSKAKLDSSGNLTVTGNLTGFGTL